MLLRDLRNILQIMKINKNTKKAKNRVCKQKRRAHDTKHFFKKCVSGPP